MASRPPGDPWDVAGTVVPRPARQRAAGYFGFVPAENRRPAAPGDPLARSVVRLLAFRVGEGTPRKAGTAVVIGPDTLVTAAHNVFDPTNSGFGTQRGGYALSVLIGSDAVHLPRPATTRFVAPPGYTAASDRAADLAVVRLDAAMSGAQALDPEALADGRLRGAPVLVYGYPELTPRLFVGRGACVAARPGALYHDADAAEGQSGGPLLVLDGGAAAFAGLHRAGPAETPGDVPPACGAVRFVAGAIDWIREMEKRL